MGAPLRRHRRQIGLNRIPRRRAPGGSSSIEKAPEFGDGLPALFELLDGGDDLVPIEDVEKIG
ncbi:hypothetical protein [Bradyrhizobium niftali]|uniref:Uncharacterized protein n=1 Tax=Bradyrhizobium niftali TaxID=2560055 RepID=A0A4Y9L2B5_9BRAD|nr:hypothetical protein [Bradyrhizobium niftali]TFV36946.1 hypothetical protein E4K65_44515 [Bradyrhizobium niftali]